MSTTLRLSFSRSGTYLVTILLKNKDAQQETTDLQFEREYEEEAT